MGKHDCTLGYFNPLLSLSGIGNQMPFKDGEGGRNLHIEFLLGKLACVALWLRYGSNTVPLMFVQISQSA